MDDPILPAPAMVYRSMGSGPSWQRIGAGVMDKSGIANDQRDVRPATWSLIYVLRGRGVYRDQDGREWALSPGWCFQRLPDRRHSTVLDPASGWRECFIDLNPALQRVLASMQALRSETPAWHWGLDAGRVQRFVDVIVALRHAGERALPGLCLDVMRLAIDAQPDPSAVAAGEDAIDRACRALAADPAGRVDLRTWCRGKGLDYERFRKDFQRRLGMPPGQYRIRRRIDRACELLETTELPIAVIANELGYPSPYEFSAQFRARMGLPPTRYRAR
ncbi:MAG: helix-turn-helix transcriptional regulator [Planctomycetes bacterium]|nr:helix-turn-helix transcriptional regulator [Planctomycetota bacterium]